MTQSNRLRAGMVGLGMIFDETYRPLFEAAHREGIFRRDFGLVEVELAAVASRTGIRAEQLPARVGRPATPLSEIFGRRRRARPAEGRRRCGLRRHARQSPFRAGPAGPRGGQARPHREAVGAERLASWMNCERLARRTKVLAKVVYHKLADPDHKKLRTHVVDGVLKHVNNGYCSLLEPKQISGSQFAEWITGRNPGTYVAVHYIKLIDFTFGGRLAAAAITATGQRGLVGPAAGPTWDSVQLQVVYTYPDGREAAFDIHTSWVTPDNFPGYVDQEVQFRFDNGVWIAPPAQARRRGHASRAGRRAN